MTSLLRRTVAAAGAAAFGVFLSLGSARAADLGKFPFVIPWDDAVASATDVSYLNDGPAGSHGQIIVRNGHFVESATGKPIRFIGVNFAFGANFPSHGDAERVAARLAKYGVNVVRFHHMDNVHVPSGSILDLTQPDHLHLSPARLDALDYLIFQLKKHGIYANLNLHVSREFSPADGFPESIKLIPSTYDKRVDYFSARMIQLQKDYARDLLTHVNPYTGLAYTRDPALLNVEITNEDSLIGDSQAPGSGLQGLPGPFRGELQSLWNRWLKAKYGTTDAMSAAWLKGITPPGDEMLQAPTDPASWQLEVQPGASSDLRAMDGSLKIKVGANDGIDWHIQLLRAGLDFVPGNTYTVTFRARADSPRLISVYTALDEPDWRHVGLTQKVNVTPDWQTFQLSFDAADSLPAHGRLAFTFGQAAGTVWLTDISLKPGVPGSLVRMGESLEVGNISQPDAATRNQRADWTRFLADTERSYATEMRRFLKDDLHLGALVVCSQIGYGGVAGPYRETGMDFVDSHAYWEHPVFPHKPWDGSDWTIENHSMVPKMGSGDALTRLGESRIFGKPFTVSEYNHPAPNDYQSECVPLLASYAAVQDWDAIYLFDYGQYGAGADNDRIEGYFGTGSNPAKWAFVPAAAVVFRSGLVAPAAGNLSFSVPGGETGLLAPEALTAYRRWCDAAGDASQQARIGMLMPESASRSAAGHGAAMTWQTHDPATARFLVTSPFARVLVGFAGGSRATVGDFTADISPLPNNFASIMLTSMDGLVLERSASILLTAVDRVENVGMQWNAERTSVTFHWGTGPTMADGVPATISFKVEGPRRVFALGPNGVPDHLVPSRYEAGLLTFKIGSVDKTLWYSIIK